MNRQYPRLVLRDSSFRSNARETISRCAACGIQVCGVIKGVNGLPEVARRFRECGVTQLGTSRLEQVERCRQAGIPGPYLLIRIPGPTELPGLVRLCEMSLQSERKTLDLLEQECTRQDKPHAVIIMADLGDLREGYWDHEEMVQTCLYVERRLPHVHLSGVGVNLSCYGSVRATPEKMQMLLAIARRVEDAIGRPLEIVSGGRHQLLSHDPYRHHARRHQPPTDRRKYSDGAGYCRFLGRPRCRLPPGRRVPSGGRGGGGEGEAHLSPRGAGGRRLRPKACL